MEPQWRIISLSLMAVALVFLVVATMSTGWREDKEERMDVLTTFGLWRICRDIKFGATLDHKCLSQLANDAPTWFQCVRAFMILGVICALCAFLHGVYTIASLPILKNKNQKPPASLVLPALLMFLGSIFALVGVSTFAVATNMDEALYFPEGLEPMWANSWAQVWSKMDSLPSIRPKVAEISTTYKYSFAMGWVGVITTLASFLVNLIASSR